MKKLIKNLSFRKKIFVTCLAVSLIPVLALGSYSYKQLNDLLITREKTAMKESLVQENSALNSKLNNYINIMNYIVYNENIRTALNDEHKSTFEMYLTYRDTIDPLFQIVRALNPDFNKLTIYTDAPLHSHGTVLRPLGDIENKDWFEKAMLLKKPFFSASAKDKKLVLICQINIIGGKNTSVLTAELDYNAVFHSIDTLFEKSYGILLYTDENEIVHEYHNFNIEKADYALTPEQLLDEENSDFLQKKYVVESLYNPSGDWNIRMYRPLDTISAPADAYTFIVIFICICCLVSVIFIGSILSKVLVRPLELLIKNMNNIESGDISVTFTYDSNDEMGQLYKTFESMVAQLHHLVEEVLTSKIKQQEYEMQALQAQINPHFLYNSLSLINSKALMEEQPEISRMAQLLSTFYRTTLNKGRNVTTVRDELANVRSYIEIQLFMHSGSFDVNYEIDENLLSCEMLHLVLQPLVENAIMHGIDHIENGSRGALTVSCYSEEEKIIFAVRDNGPGIPEEKTDSILTSVSSGYGIQNVHHRIQLYYGEKYGLHYESAKGQGTCVYLEIRQ